MRALELCQTGIVPFIGIDVESDEAGDHANDDVDIGIRYLCKPGPYFGFSGPAMLVIGPGMGVADCTGTVGLHVPAKLVWRSGLSLPLS